MSKGMSQSPPSSLTEWAAHHNYILCLKHGVLPTSEL